MGNDAMTKIATAEFKAAIKLLASLLRFLRRRAHPPT